MLKVEKINVHYGVINAIKNVSFEVNDGEIVALIGANGAGKTSIMHAISAVSYTHLDVYKRQIYHNLIMFYQFGEFKRKVN